MIARRGASPAQHDAVRQAVPFTVTMVFGKSEVAHRSLASSWAVAVDLAMRSVRRDGIASLDAIPDSIRVESR